MINLDCYELKGNSKLHPCKGIVQVAAEHEYLKATYTPVFGVLTQPYLDSEEYGASLRADHVKFLQ